MEQEGDTLALSGVPRKYIQTKDVVVGYFNNKNVCIRTSVFSTPHEEEQKDDKPKLVMVHGFASSGPLYFKILGRLAEHFVVVLIDIIGMGSSSRPNNFDKNNLTP